jgi:hypothetical protein
MGETRHRHVQRAPAANGLERDDADNDDAEPEQDALHRIDIGDGA